MKRKANKKNLESLQRAAVNLACEMNECSMVMLEPAETYDKAIVGISEDNRVVYQWDKLVSAVAEDCAKCDATNDDPETAAIEWLEYNTIRSIPYMGENAPIIIHSIEEFC